MKKLSLMAAVVMVMCLMAAPAFANGVGAGITFNATMDTPGEVDYDGGITYSVPDYDSYIRVYADMTDVVLDYEITETVVLNEPQPFSGTLTFDGPVPARLFVEFWAYKPDPVVLNKNNSIYHYADWMLSSVASDAYASIGPAAPSLSSFWEATLFINSPIVDAGVTELDFSADPSIPQDIVITNDGYVDLTVTGVSTPDNPFSMNEDCVGTPITAGGICTITVSYDDGSAALKSNNALYASLGSGIFLLGIGLAFAPKGSKSTIVIILLAITLSVGVLQACGSDSDTTKHYITITSDDPNGDTVIDLIK